MRKRKEKTLSKNSGKIHDKGYKKALSSKTAFLEFVSQFISSTLIEGISADDLVLMDKSFIDEALSEFESDVVYQLKRPEQDVYFYVLVELQSTVDFTMPFRLLRYMVNVQERHFNNTDINVRKSKDYRLPVVIPFVLYNGENKWSPSRSYRDYQEKIEDIAPELLPVVLDFQYVVLDVNANTVKDLCRTGLLSFILAFDHKNHIECELRNNTHSVKSPLGKYLFIYH